MKKRRRYQLWTSDTGEILTSRLASVNNIDGVVSCYLYTFTTIGMDSDR